MQGMAVMSSNPNERTQDDPKDSAAKSRARCPALIKKPHAWSQSMQTRPR
jgi:hypothetical protein